MSNKIQQVVNFLLSNDNPDHDKLSQLAENMSAKELMDALELSLEMSESLKQTAVGRALL
jgi:hypothetical protein